MIKFSKTYMVGYCYWLCRPRNLQVAYKFFKTTQERLERRKRDEKNGAAAGRVGD